MGSWVVPALTVFLVAASAAQHRFAVAIVRPDGRLVPFAAYADGRWERAWPAPEYAPSRPTVADVQPVTAIQDVPRTAAAWHTAEASLAPHIDRLETAAAEAERRAFPAPERPIARLRALYREAGTATSPMYFVAEKKYSTARSPQDPGCTDTTVVTGWLFPDGKGGFTLQAPSKSAAAAAERCGRPQADGHGLVLGLTAPVNTETTR